MSILAILLTGLICIKSTRLPNLIMIIATLVFCAGFTVCAVIAIANHDSALSYEPSFRSRQGLPRR